MNVRPWRGAHVIVGRLKKWQSLQLPGVKFILPNAPNAPVTREGRAVPYYIFAF